MGCRPLGGHGEEGVERDYAIDLRGRNAQLAGNDALHFFWQVALQALCLVQDVDEFALVVSVALADVHHLLFHVTREFCI